MKRERERSQGTVASREHADAYGSRGVREETGVVVARDGRNHPRVAARLAARLSTLDPCKEPHGERFYVLASACTLDVADGGVRLESDGAVMQGQRVVVEVELADGTTVERSGRVAWSREEHAGVRVLGVSFDESIAGLATCALARA